MNQERPKSKQHDHSHQNAAIDTHKHAQNHADNSNTKPKIYSIIHL